MLTCENCGVHFERADTLVEVTSLRILCPKCTTERAAAKARRAAPSLATAPAATPAPAAPPVPATRPVPRPAAAPQASAGTETRPRSPTPAPAPPPAARETKPAARETRPAEVKPADRPAARQSAAKPSKKKKIDLDSLPSHDLQKRGSREILIASLSAVLVLAVAGVVLWKVRARQTAEQQVAQAKKDKIARFQADFAAMPMTTEEEAQKLLDFAEENKSTWSEQEFAAEVMSRTAKAKTYLQDQDRRRKLTQRLDELEATMAKAAELPPTELAEVRRSLEELAAGADFMGADFVARITKDRADGEAVYLERLMGAAETAAATEPLDRAALTTIQQSEDEVFKIFNTTALAWQKNTQDPDLTAKKGDLQTRYQTLIRLSDAAVARFFTPEVIESTPWQDFLADERASAWKGGNDIKGFERRQGNGVLHLIGPDPSEKSDAVISIGDKEAWRDLVIDMEFTIEKGSFDLFLRLPIVFQDNTFAAPTMDTAGDGSLEAGRSYSWAMRLLGSDFTYENKSEDSPDPTTESISWTKPRKGAFGISVPKDTEIKFTRLRVKVLR